MWELTMGNLQMVFFDMGGVLVRSMPLFSYIANRIEGESHVDAELVRTSLVDHFNEKLKIVRNLLVEFKDVKDLFEESFSETMRVLQIGGIPPRRASELYEKFFIDHVKLYPDTLPCLEALRNLGIRLGIISDADWDVLEVEIERLGLMGFFDVIITSSMVKAYKPNPKIFLVALSKASCLAENSAYVGDSDVDVIGSKKIGMFSVLLDRGRRRYLEKSARKQTSSPTI